MLYLWKKSNLTGVFKGWNPLGEGVAENGVVELVETTPVAARGRRPFFQVVSTDSTTTQPIAQNCIFQ